jgi:hypothetical protein
MPGQLYVAPLCTEVPISTVPPYGEDGTEESFGQNAREYGIGSYRNSTAS